jgi:O-antigen/teichoic acid export membrane protein
MLLVLPQILASSIFPQIASGEQNEQVVSIISRLFRLFLLIYLLLIVFVFLFGFRLFLIIFGSSFTTMNIPVLILLPGIFCLSFSALLSAYFSGKKANKHNVYAAIFALFVMIGLSFLFKENYNIQKAAFISTIAYFCESLYCVVIFSKMENISFKNLLHFQPDDFKWIKKYFS